MQAYEGALRAVESGDAGRARSRRPARQGGGRRARRVVASAASRGCIGGGTFSRRSPFAAWFEDVRALGFLRPPWGLAYDGLFATSFDG